MTITARRVTAAAGRAVVPLPDHPDHQRRSRPGDDPARHRRPLDGGDRLPRLLHLLPRRRPARAPGGLERVRPPRGHRQPAGRQGPGRLGGVDAAAAPSSRRTRWRTPGSSTSPRWRRSGSSRWCRCRCFARAGDVIGVINLHTEAPREFARDDLEFIEHTASLVAGAIENAHLYQDATRRVAMLTELSAACRTASPCAADVDELARRRSPRAACRPSARTGRRSTSPTPTAASGSGRPCPTADDAPVLDPETLRFDALVGRGGGAAERRSPAPRRALWAGAPRTPCPCFAPLAVGEGPPGLLCVLSPGALGRRPQRRLGRGGPRRRGAAPPRTGQPAAGGERRQGLLRGALPGQRQPE